MASEWTVYKHINNVNGKVYIRITSQNPERRWGYCGNRYLKIKNGKYCQPAMANAILKYGWDSFSHEIIATGLTIEEAEGMEKELILKYKSNIPKYGYNIREGGLDGQLPQESVKQCILAREGYHHSEETKQKISEHNKGKTVSKGAKERMSKSHSKPKPRPQEKEKGHDTYNQVYCKCVETGECFPSVSNAAVNIGSYVSNILKCIQGLRYRARGYHWVQISKEEYIEYTENNNI